MWHSFILSAVLAVGQSAPPTSAESLPRPTIRDVYAVPSGSAVRGGSPVRLPIRDVYPAPNPTQTVPRPLPLGSSARSQPVERIPPPQAVLPGEGGLLIPEPAFGSGPPPLLTPPAPEAPAAAAAQPASSDGYLMQALQGSWPGAVLEGHRLQISGWTAASFTASSAQRSNAPVVWNDRANEFLLQQHWTRFERPIITTGTEPSFGFRTDLLIGSDYRFTIPRGLFNSQLEKTIAPGSSADDNQNLYGVDPIAFYTRAYFPTLFQGTEFRVGRQYTPFGVESLEAVSTPLVSRSYAFNFSPPFTHMGISALTTYTPQWSSLIMLANGNDVFLDPAQEARFVGTVTWTSINKQDTVTLGTSLGRGKFNAGQPYAPTTVALPNEPAGRNNINVFDLVWSHVFNDRLSYTYETIYGYQYGVPANVGGGITKLNATSGTAHWGSIVHYLFYNINPQLTSILRVETFDDFEGQRTGFEGLYTAVTGGMQYRPMKGMEIRPELRYDYNGYSQPFEDRVVGGNVIDRRNWIITAALEMIFRW
jgi:Putative beta-barrel porin-2, OmpL-like. bbp2